jgi:zinc/manganese transport system substrate-binding protein
MRTVLTLDGVARRAAGRGIRAAAVVGACALVVVGCGDGDGNGSASVASDDRPTVVVTTSVWGDVVESAFGDVVDVDVLMPLGADPHDFAPSALQAAQMEESDLVVANGLGLEEGLTSVIESVADSGTPVVAIGELIATTPDDEHAGDDDDEHAGDDEHADGDDEHADDEQHAHAGGDPHVWMDPVAVADALPVLGERVAEVTGLPAADVAEGVDAYAERLRLLDAEIETILADVPAERRILVTNHGSFGAFADRYGFEVVGTVIPANTTNAEASASDLDRLAEVIRDADVPAIFVETTEPDRLARALADEVGGGVRVVELYTGSLGGAGSGADSFLGFHATNAERIAAALEPS